MSNLKMVLVVSNDLNMRKGKVGAQCGHAVQGALLDFTGAIPILKTDPLVIEYFTGPTTKIVVKVDTEEDLFDVHKKAKEAGLNTYLVRDNGTTEFGGVPTYTVVAIGPARCEDIDPITSHLTLL
jgi:PTH2 family peptidyl-tRNA hydrolase